MLLLMTMLPEALVTVTASVFDMAIGMFSVSVPAKPFDNDGLFVNSSDWLLAGYSVTFWFVIRPIL